MSRMLSRNAYDERRLEYNRIGIAIACLLIGSLAWYVARNKLVLTAARSSIGGPMRERLVEMGLRIANVDLEHQPQAWKWDYAYPEWIAWSQPYENIALTDNVFQTRWLVRIANHDLFVSGSVVANRLALPPGDRDGDGNCEVVVEIQPRSADSTHVWWLVLRVLGDHNEIVWLARADESVWHNQQIRLKPIWTDHDGDGLQDLIFITVEYVRSPAGGYFKEPRTIAVLAWTQSGGILHEQTLPDDAGIVPWQPEGDPPMRVKPDTDLADLARQLLPVED